MRVFLSGGEVVNFRCIMKKALLVFVIFIVTSFFLIVVKKNNASTKVISISTHIENRNSIVFNKILNDNYLKLIERNDCLPNCIVDTQAIIDNRRVQVEKSDKRITRYETAIDSNNRHYIHRLSRNLNLVQYVAKYKFSVSDNGTISLPRDLNRIVYLSSEHLEVQPPVELIYPLLETLYNHGFVDVIERADGKINSFKVIKDIEDFKYSDSKRKLDTAEILWRVPFFNKLNLRPDSVIRSDVMVSHECLNPKVYFKAAFEPVGFWGEEMFSNFSELFFESCDDGLHGGHKNRKMFRLDFNF